LSDGMVRNIKNNESERASIRPRSIVIVALISWLMANLTLASLPASLAHASESNKPNSEAASKLSNEQIAALSLQMFSVQGSAKTPIVEHLAALNDKSLIPTFVLAMRWTGSDVRVSKALLELTGEKLTNWHDAYAWQQRHPEIIPHSTYRDLKLWFLGNTDERFLTLFEEPHGRRENMRIRLEEIVWGGALYDDIPSLDHATMIAADEADYLLDQDLVFGVEINGDVRAYPLRILGWHEMVNDVIGGVPVALAYCTLCGSGILYETQLEGREQPLVFGSSGLLYRSNKLMLERNTKSLWNQYNGAPVVGAMASSNIKLKIRPVTISSWQDWRTSNPSTTVLSLDTGYIRNYDSGFVYREYFDSPHLMFPAAVNDESSLQKKDYVFGVRGLAASKAWPLDVFTDTPVINDKVGTQSLVLIGDTTTRAVRAYERNHDETFELAAGNSLTTSENSWYATESFLESANGEQKRARIAGHISYWFAWDNFLGVRSELYKR